MSVNTKETIIVFPNFPRQIMYNTQVIFHAAGRHVERSLKIYFIVQIYLIYSWKIMWNLYYSRIFELRVTVYFSLFMYGIGSQANLIKFRQLRLEAPRINHISTEMSKDRSLSFFIRFRIKQVLLHSTRDLLDSKRFWCLQGTRIRWIKKCSVVSLDEVAWRHKKTSQSSP